MWQNTVHAANKKKYSSINRIAIAERASLQEVDRPSHFIFGLIFFRHERTKMTSETPENTIFVRFHFTLCYLMLTAIPLSSESERKLLIDQFMIVTCHLKENNNFQFNANMASAPLPHKTISVLSSKASREVHVRKEQDIASLLEGKDALAVLSTASEKALGN